VFHLIPSKNQTVLGIDVSDRAIRVVQISSVVERSQTQYYLEHYAEVVLPAQLVFSAAQSMLELQQQAVRQLFAGLPLPYDKIVMALPMRDVRCKTLHLHAGLSESDLAALVRMEVLKESRGQHHLFFDYKVLGASLDDLEKLEVQVVMADAEVVQQRLHVTQPLQTKVDVLEIECYTLARMLPWMATSSELVLNHYLMVVNLDKTRIEVAIFCNIGPIFSHDQRLIADEHQPEAYQAAVLAQVKNALQFFTLSHLPVRIDNIFLIGTWVWDESAALFEQQLAIPTQTANPFVHLHRAQGLNQSKLSEDAPKFVLATGLAMRVAESVH